MNGGNIRNLKYDAMYSSSYSSALLERSYYADIWGSPVVGANHKASFAIDDKVDHSKAAGNYRSKSGFQKPWIEIHLTSPVLISGLEVTTLGHEDKKRFKKVIFRAGLTQSPLANGGGGNALQTHNTYVYEYVDQGNTKGEVIYINFPEPMVAKYILLQGNDFKGSRQPTDSVVLEMAEVRIIKCKFLGGLEILTNYLNPSILFLAEFLGCPAAEKKWDSPQGVSSHSVSGWGECAAKCSSLPTCTRWQYDPADGEQQAEVKASKNDILKIILILR